METCWGVDIQLVAPQQRLGNPGVDKIAAAQNLKKVKTSKLKLNNLGHIHCTYGFMLSSYNCVKRIFFDYAVS